MTTYAEPLDIDRRPSAHIHRIYDLLWISGGWWDATNIGDRLGITRPTVAATCCRNPEYIDKRTVHRNGYDVVEYRARRR